MARHGGDARSDLQSSSGGLGVLLPLLQALLQVFILIMWAPMLVSANEGQDSELVGESQPGRFQ